MADYIQLIGKKILNKIVADDPYVDIFTDGNKDIYYIPLFIDDFDAAWWR